MNQNTYDMKSAENIMNTYGDKNNMKYYVSKEGKENQNSLSYKLRELKENQNKFQQAFSRTYL